LHDLWFVCSEHLNTQLTASSTTTKRKEMINNRPTISEQDKTRIETL